MRIDIDHLTMPEPEAVALLAAEVRRLRGAIAALAEQDATLAVCEGKVIVTMDATLTVEERAAIAYYVGTGGSDVIDAVLVSLLERTGDTPATHATPGEGTSQGVCTLRDEEREAISRDLSWLQFCEHSQQIGDVGRRDIATLRGLLERTA
jgi:hypothetical protein